jgi:hypothetical protein
VTSLRYSFNKLEIALRGPAFAGIPTPADSVEVEVSIHGATACGRFTGFKINSDGRLISNGPSEPCE